MTFIGRLLSVCAFCAALAFPAAVIAADMPSGPFTAPIEPSGLVYSIKARINGAVTANLVVDTGSSYTVISEKLAASLNLGGLDKAPRAPLATVAGITWARLVALDSVSAGGAAARLVEGAVIPGLPDGVDGYLGLSYLNQFTYRIDASARTISLAIPDEAAPLYAGAGQKWWMARFSPLCESVRKYRAYGARLDNRLIAARPGETKGFTEDNLERLVSFYSGLHGARAARAARLGVPEEWIERP